jgi:hypothetical protein
MSIATSARPYRGCHRLNCPDARALSPGPRPLLLSEFIVTNPNPRLVFGVAIMLMLLPVVL